MTLTHLIQRWSLRFLPKNILLWLLLLYILAFCIKIHWAITSKSSNSLPLRLSRNFLALNILINLIAWIAILPWVLLYLYSLPRLILIKVLLSRSRYPICNLHWLRAVGTSTRWFILFVTQLDDTANPFNRSFHDRHFYLNRWLLHLYLFLMHL